MGPRLSCRAPLDVQIAVRFRLRCDEGGHVTKADTVEERPFRDCVSESKSRALAPGEDFERGRFQRYRPPLHEHSIDFFQLAAAADSGLFHVPPAKWKPMPVPTSQRSLNSPYAILG